MGRYSPTVLPQAFNLGDAIDRAMQGLDAGRAVKRQRTLDEQQKLLFKQGQEDRDAAMANQRAEQLSRPGARSLADFLGDATNYNPEDENATGGPLTPETLARVGDAGQSKVPLDFKAPAPMPSFLPGGQSVPMPMAGGGGTMAMPMPTMVPRRPPVMTAEGVVMDPQAASRENTLSAILQGQVERSTHPYQPYTREEMLGDEEERTRRKLDLEEGHFRNMIPIDEARSRARAIGGGLLDPRTGQRTAQEGRGKNLSLDAVEKQIKDTTTELNIALRTSYPPGLGATDAEREAYQDHLDWIDTLRERADSLEGVRSTMVSKLPGVEAAAEETPPVAGARGGTPKRPQVKGPQPAATQDTTAAQPATNLHERATATQRVADSVATFNKARERALALQGETVAGKPKYTREQIRQKLKAEGYNLK